MGAIAAAAAAAAELRFCTSNFPLSSTTYQTRQYGSSGIESRSSRLGGAAFGLRNWAEIDPLYSSSTGRWLLQFQGGKVRGIRSLKGLDGGRGVGGERRKGGGTRAMAEQQGRWGKLEAPKPTFVALEQITGEEHFDQILSEAVGRNQPIIVDWLAAWCRKCIYLKPKLEKLAAEYHPDLKFYYVDVNTVPQALVKRADVTKMPTIQLWKDNERLAEVIGGHQAWLVLDEIREMIKSKK